MAMHSAKPSTANHSQFRFNHSSVPSAPPATATAAAASAHAGSLTVYVTRQSLEAACGPPCTARRTPSAAAKLRTLGLSISSIRDKCHVTARREWEARESESESDGGRTRDRCQ